MAGKEINHYGSQEAPGAEEIRTLGKPLEACPVLLSEQEAQTFYATLHERVDAMREVSSLDTELETARTRYVYASNEIDDPAFTTRVPVLSMLFKQQETVFDQSGRAAVLISKYRHSQPEYKFFNKFVVERNAEGELSQAYRMVRVIRCISETALNDQDVLEETLLQRKQSTFYEPLQTEHIERVRIQMDQIIARSAVLALRKTG